MAGKLQKKQTLQQKVAAAGDAIRVGNTFRDAFERDRARSAQTAVAPPVQRGQVFPVSWRGVKRASLVELKNDSDSLEFHWNPTSYTISKSSSWSETSVDQGTPTVSWSGSSLTKVSFELLLNDIAQPHKIQRSTEDSIQWLYDRLRARTEGAASRTTAQESRNLPWLGIRNFKARSAPPVLVLFGLGKPFVCVLEFANVTTIFQAPVGEISPFATDETMEVRITRATVAIALKEFANDPTVESE